MARTPSLARLSLVARTGAPSPAERAKRGKNTIVQFSRRIPKELWDYILNFVIDENECANIEALCKGEGMPWSGWCKDGTLYEQLNARLGWYGPFASLEAVRAHFASPGTEVDWTVPETAMAYFQMVCAAFRGVGTDLDLIESGKFVDLHEGRPYFALLAKRVVRIDPKALRHVPYVPEYVEIATVAVREEGAVLEHLLSNVLEYDEYVQLATIAVAQEPELVEHVMSEWFVIVNAPSGEDASKVATDLAIACAQSRKHDLRHMQNVMNVLEENDYGDERVDVPRVFREAVAFCAAEHAARVRAIEGLEASADAKTKASLDEARTDSSWAIGYLATRLRDQRPKHEDAYRAAVVEAAKNFDVLRMFIDAECPVVKYIAPSDAPQYMEALEYVARRGDKYDLEHATHLSVDQHYSLVRMAVARPLISESGSDPLGYLKRFLHTRPFTPEQTTDLVISAMNSVRSSPRRRWPDPNRFLNWFVPSLEWDSQSGTELRSIDGLGYDLVRIFDAAVVQIGTEANKPIPPGARAFEWAQAEWYAPYRSVKAYRTNWLHAQYEKVLFFARCHYECKQRVIERMADEFNRAMLFLPDIEFGPICLKAALAGDFKSKVDQIERAAPTDVASDGIVAYPGFEYPGYAARERDARTARTIWKTRREWLEDLEEWSRRIPPPPADWPRPPPPLPDDA